MSAEQQPDTLEHRRQVLKQQVPAIAQELASDVQSDNVPKYLAAVLRTYKELGEPNDRLATTIDRVGFANFQKEVETKLELPYDDIIQTAKEIREKEKNAECIDE